MAEEKRQIVSRGEYGTNVLGTTIFIGLRALDGFVIQRALQVLDPMPGLLTKLGLERPPTPPTGGPPLAMSAHDLTPFQAVIWAMAMGNAVKHILWVSLIGKEPMRPESALLISSFNCTVNSVNTLAFSLASVNPTWSESTLLYVSVPMYVVGWVIEVVSEVQRKRFKDDPKNKGKPYSGGLFGYARSINYFGDCLRRVAFGLACGGWLLGGVMALGFGSVFIKSSVPELDAYCSKRYGAQWQEVKRKVPYAFIPGLY